VCSTRRVEAWSFPSAARQLDMRTKWQASPTSEGVFEGRDRATKYGVTASPTQTTSYTQGTVVNYKFTATDGFSTPYVTLDSNVAQASGTVTMDAVHSLTALLHNEPGYQAPDFSGQTAGGQTIRLSDYSGKVVLIDFSEKTCPGSIAEAPSLRTHYSKYHSRGLEILTVLVQCPGLHNCPTNQVAAASDLSAWTQTYSLPFPVVTDQSHATTLFNWTVSTSTPDFPAGYIVDAGGTIRYRFRGYNEADLSAALATLFP